MPETKRIFFFNEPPIDYRLRHKTTIRKWLTKVAQQEQHQILLLNYVFCSDDYLLALNQRYLNHHTYTDILTFDHSEEAGQIESDIFISINRVKENAKTFKTLFTNELYRVMIHGLLHLCGYGDKSTTEKQAMRKKEDASVKQLLLDF